MIDYKEYLIVTDSLTHDEVIQVPVLDEDGSPVYDEDGNPVTEDKVIQVLNYPPEDFRAVVNAGMRGEQFLVMITHTENPVLEGDTLVYGFNPYTGEKVELFDEALYREIRPLGNHEDGSATGYLGFDTWAGAEKRQCGNEFSTDPMARIYPGEPPFEVRFRRKYFDAAEHSGEGWRAEVTAGTSRDGSEYFIAIYRDATCTVDDFWFNTLFLSIGPSEWQFDNEGEPLQVYQTEYNMAERGQPERAAIHHGLCKGSIHIQEGFDTLELEDEEDVYEFWPYRQGSGGERWVDTGATVAAQYGTIYLISDADVCAALIPGQAIKFTETGEETTFTDLRPGFADQIQIDPFVQAAVGDALWSFASAATARSSNSGVGKGKNKRSPRHVL